MSDTNPYRLPRTVEPERYELTLTPDIDHASFTGEERIRVAVHEPVQTISLNSAELEILSAELINDLGVTLTGSVSIDENAEVAAISFDQTAEAGSWTLHITFTGTLNDKLRGFYRSVFKDDDGNERVIATTQFEATDARRAFPCWDEPEFKAVFAVTLIVDDHLAAFSNAAVVDESSLGTGKKQIEFADTIKMSTYLVAFVVGPLVVTDPIDVDGVPLRVACVPGREALRPFAIETGAAALRYFAEYFKIPYPGGKLDLIALPDFAFGAMENLGCVTFRETALLVDTERASHLEIERVADVVGHEVAHMWFGDLVTMKWWNGIWLNEAFATFMELMFVDNFRPEWERWVQFLISKAAALNIDSLSSTRPIEFEVIRPEEAQGMFDLLTYQKGGAVLRMLEQYLGPDQFASGIGHYLNKHAYANAETSDLWDALEYASKQPVRALMDSWILQGGHPIVHVSKGDNDNQLVVTQKRFLYLDEPDLQAKWHIPIGIRAVIDGKVHHEKLLLTDTQAVIEMPGSIEWAVVNERANGFFRVSYESDLLLQLTNNITELDSLERFTLMIDTWAACLAGRTSINDVLALVRVLGHDNDPNVWGAILTPLRLLDKIVDDSDRSKLEQLVRDVATPVFEQLTWKPEASESERISTLRGTIISALGIQGNDKIVQQQALAFYNSYLDDPTSLDPNLIDPVQMIIAAINKVEYFEVLYKVFSAESSTPQQKINALQTLACFTTPDLVARTLEMVRSGVVRTQDAPYTIRIMLARRESASQVWDWCEENWDDLMSRFPDNSIASMIDGVTAQVDPQLAQRVQDFMTKHPVPQAAKLVDQTCERLRVNVAFYEREKSNIPNLNWSQS